MSGKLVDQMMAALAKKNAALYPSLKNPDGSVKQTKPVRNTGPVPNKPQKKVTGRGR